MRTTIDRLTQRIESCNDLDWIEELADFVEPFLSAVMLGETEVLNAFYEGIIRCYKRVDNDDEARLRAQRFFALLGYLADHPTRRELDMCGPGRAFHSKAYYGHGMQYVRDKFELEGVDVTTLFQDPSGN